MKFRHFFPEIQGGVCVNCIFSTKKVNYYAAKPDGLTSFNGAGAKP